MLFYSCKYNEITNHNISMHVKAIHFVSTIRLYPLITIDSVHHAHNDSIYSLSIK
jgi:hypothetical protein